MQRSESSPLPLAVSSSPSLSSPSLSSPSLSSPSLPSSSLPSSSSSSYFSGFFSRQSQSVTTEAGAYLAALNKESAPIEECINNLKRKLDALVKIAKTKGSESIENKKWECLADLQGRLLKWKKRAKKAAKSLDETNKKEDKKEIALFVSEQLDKCQEEMGKVITEDNLSILMVCRDNNVYYFNASVELVTAASFIALFFSATTAPFSLALFLGMSVGGFAAGTIENLAGTLGGKPESYRLMINFAVSFFKKRRDFLLDNPCLVPNYYELLGVEKEADESAITKAYRALALRYHPDKGTEKDKERNTKKMAELNKARDVLLDPTQRAEHDKELKKYEQFCAQHSRPAYKKG